MLENVGVHWNDSVGVMAGFKQWPMPLAVVLDHSPDAWREVKEMSPETVLVGRVTPDEGQDWTTANPTAEARWAMERILPMAERMQGIIDVFIQWNEPIIADENAMDRYTSACIYLTESLSRHGVRSAVGGFAEGNPHIGYWKTFEPALRSAMQLDGIAHVHEYDWGWIGATIPWRTLRLAQVIFGNWSNYPPTDPRDIYDGLPIDLCHGLNWAVTEFGIDRGEGIRKGWKTATNNDPFKYMNQIESYCRFWREIAAGKRLIGIDFTHNWDNLIGMAIFCKGHGWPDFDIAGSCYDLLAYNATPQYYDFDNTTPEPPEPEPPIIPDPPPVAEIRNRPLVGLHLRNDRRQSNMDGQILKDAKIEAIKVMTPVNDFADVMEIWEDTVLRVKDGIIRIYESGRPDNVSNFVAKHAPTLKEYHAAGMRKVEVLNEPNHVAGIEGWGSTDAHARDFASWFDLAAPTLKEAVPGIEIGFPGLAVPGFVHHDFRWLDICRDVILRHADWLGCHCYWQEDNRTSPTWGNRHKAYHDRFPTLPIEITEFGDSTPNLTNQRQADQIYRYYKQLETYPYIRGAYAFIQSSPDPMWGQLPFSWTHNGQPGAVVDAVGSYNRASLIAVHPFLLPGYKYIGERLTKHKKKRYSTRTLHQIRTITIHHTAIPHTVTAERIAQYHVHHNDWAGIGYGFYQKRNKPAVQTNPMNVVSAHVKHHNTHSLGIAVAGMFNNQAPPREQLEHLADLCADLLTFLPQGQTIAIQGHNEMYGHYSNACPGHTFKKRPPRWLNILIEMVEAKLAAREHHV